MDERLDHIASDEDMEDEDENLQMIDEVVGG